LSLVQTEKGIKTDANNREEQGGEQSAQGEIIKIWAMVAIQLAVATDALNRDQLGMFVSADAALCDVATRERFQAVNPPSRATSYFPHLFFE